MNVLADIIAAVETLERFVGSQVQRAKGDSAFAAQILEKLNRAGTSTGTTTTPTGLVLPRLAIPAADEPAEAARYLFGEGLPGEFPFMNGAYPQMYLDHSEGDGKSPAGGNHVAEEPTRLFAGLGLAEDTNRRFNTIAARQKHVRLSTAFDGPTLYGIDSDADGVFGKIGEGGVAIDTIEDMARLYAGFPLGDEHFSASMTINGPAPVLLAMYVAAAIGKFGPDVVAKLRGTVQADVLKEVQAQNEMIFPTDAALRLLGDMVEYTTANMPRWYPVSISGYHIAEAGATPVQQAAYTLSNGFAYVELFRQRGLDVNRFGPRLSFFLDCGLEIEYLALARVCRKIWAIGMRDVFKAGESAQRFKLHTQTSGRSLIASGFKNNLSRTAVELVLAYINGTNSCHSNSADEPFTTPSEEYVRLAANSQAILLEESGLFKHMMNALGSSPGMRIVEAAVERGILEELAEIQRLGGVLAATEYRYQRSRIQSSAHRYEQQISDGTRPIVGLNRYRDEEDTANSVAIVRTSARKKQQQIERLRRFKNRNAKKSGPALDALAAVAERGGNVFAELIETVKYCSLGQITGRLQEVFGKYRPMV